jgi:DNA-binding MarR family transcriptional regulator
VASAAAGATDAEAFLVAFDAFAQAVRRARGATGALPGALTLSQYALLEPLIDAEQARVRELAARAGIAAPTATRILDTLERRGLVNRCQASDDRRGVSVGLTRDGRRALVGHHQWLRSRQRAFFVGLAADQRALAPGLLDRLAELIDELAPGPGA